LTFHRCPVEAFTTAQYRTSETSWSTGLQESERQKLMLVAMPAGTVPACMQRYTVPACPLTVNPTLHWEHRRSGHDTKLSRSNFAESRSPPDHRAAEPPDTAPAAPCLLEVAVNRRSQCGSLPTPVPPGIPATSAAILQKACVGAITRVPDCLRTCASPI